MAGEEGKTTIGRPKKQGMHAVLDDIKKKDRNGKTA